MASQWLGEVGGGKGRCVGSLWVHLRVTVGQLRVIMGHLRVTIGHQKVTIGHLRVIMGHLRVTRGYLYRFFSTSKHKANTTELHPKVRQTCYCTFVIKYLLNAAPKLSRRCIIKWNESKKCIVRRWQDPAHLSKVQSGGWWWWRSDAASLTPVSQSVVSQPHQ